MRSLLFVPADAPAKLDKALGAGTDALIVDLEDSVAPERKALARTTAAVFLSATTGHATSGHAARPRLLVRVNGLATGLIDADLDAIVAARPDAIMLPKPT
jgi:citrate lyase subunit beta/citryl-CoA lyase